MYGIYGYIWYIWYNIWGILMVNVSIPYMDPMGLVMTNSLLLNMAIDYVEIVDLAIKHISHRIHVWYIHGIYIYIC